MNQKSMSVKRLVRCAVIAAIYVVLCLVLQPFSYGAVQVRVAEAFCLLPIFGTEYIIGVTLGCFLAKLRNVRVKGLAIPASLPPVISNMFIVGAFEITFFFSDTAPTMALACFNAVAVAVGELISCTILGVALVKLIETNASLKKIFTEE